MTRREVIAAFAAALAVARAQTQPTRTPAVIGWLGTISHERARELKRHFEIGMRALGYEEGRDYLLEERHAEGDSKALPKLAADLAARRPKVIVAGSMAAVIAAKRVVGSAIPIVSPTLADPIDLGIIESYARPSTNVTGILLTVEELSGKQFSLAVELVGDGAPVGVLASPTQAKSIQSRGVEAARIALAAEIALAQASSPEGFDSAFHALKNANVRVVHVLGDAMFLNESARLAASALSAGLPTVFPLREHVEAGGLMSYGVNLGEAARRAAVFVDKILKGENPGDLPVELPTHFELVVNLKTARALGLTIPPALLARADEVIE